jgi:hypothetical protein
MLSHPVLQSRTAQPFRGANPHTYSILLTLLSSLYTGQPEGTMAVKDSWATTGPYTNWAGCYIHPLKGPNVLVGPTLWPYVQCRRHMPYKHVHAALMDHYWAISKLGRVSHTPPQRNRRPRRSNSIYGHTSSSGAICHAVYPICTHTCHALYARTMTRI